MDVGWGRRQKPSQPKFEAFEKPESPYTWADLYILISLFSFYKKFLSLYEMYLRPWREILAKQSCPGSVAAEEER